MHTTLFDSETSVVGRVLVISAAVLTAAALAVVMTVHANGGQAHSHSSTSQKAAVVSATTAPQQQVAITRQGGDPAKLSVRLGETVTFTNHTGQRIALHSGPHPVHTSLQEFDSGNLADGESYTFTFTKPGNFTYHDHYVPSIGGSVEVR